MLEGMRPYPAAQPLLHSPDELPGVCWGRREDVVELHCSIKDRYAYAIARRGHTDSYYRGRVESQGPGTLRIVEPGELYRELRQDGPKSFDVVMFEPALFDEVRMLGGRRAGPLRSPVLSCNDVRIRPLLQLNALLQEPATVLQRQSALADALTALRDLLCGESALPRHPERSAVRRARSYLLDHLCQPVTLDALADSVGIDKYHLSRAFHTEVGVPPYEFLTQARMLRARQLLRSGMSAAAVAAAVGYYDQSQLHRHFRRIVGVTPGQFMRG